MPPRQDTGWYDRLSHTEAKEVAALDTIIEATRKALTTATLRRDFIRTRVKQRKTHAAS